MPKAPSHSPLAPRRQELSISNSSVNMAYNTSRRALPHPFAKPSHGTKKSLRTALVSLSCRERQSAPPSLPLLRVSDRVCDPAPLTLGCHRRQFRGGCAEASPKTS